MRTVIFTLLMLAAFACTQNKDPRKGYSQRKTDRKEGTSAEQKNFLESQYGTQPEAPKTAE